jgi:hypothetical protein
VRQLNEHDEFAVSIWNRIKEPLKNNLQAVGLEDVKTVSDADIQNLENILDKEIPSLRRKASPARFSLNDTEGNNGWDKNS